MSEPLKGKRTAVGFDGKCYDGNGTYFRYLDIKSAVEDLKGKLCQRVWVENKICKKDYCPNCKAINNSFEDVTGK